MTIAAAAESLARRGEIAAAVARLEAATGDVDALAMLANWLLVGNRIPRDLPRARALLVRAATIGHVDAALIAIAFTANGTGAPADWPAALAALRHAAINDSVAAAQLALVDTMALTPAGIPARPPPERRLSAAPDVRLFPALLTTAECAHVAAVARDLLEPSMVVDPVTGASRPDRVRTSHGTVIGPAREDLVIRAINQRIATASGTRIEQGEPLAVLHYAPGQQYYPHHDALPGAVNQRGWTMLVYLNTGYHGGETHFSATRLTVRGRPGDGVLFRNLDAAGDIDPLARHAGLPVTAGVKWLCTRWIRLGAHDPWSGG